ncbi:MAG: hypothetical protein KAJ91_03805 [Candidatus Aenigmarchaeota archaeon]|nr:hypothetical protein [Candidatus Aenigmarchaeota archaeon]
MWANLSFLAITDFALFLILALVSLQWTGREKARVRFYFSIMAVSFFFAGAYETAMLSSNVSAQFHYIHVLFSAMVFSFFAAEMCGIKKIKSVSVVLALVILLVSGSVNIVRMTYLVAVVINFISFFVLFEFAHGRMKTTGVLGLIATSFGAAIVFADVPSLTFERFWFVANIFFGASFAVLLYSSHNSKFLLPRNVRIVFDESKLSFSKAVKPLLYIILYLALMNVVLVFASLALHEAGHFFIGSMHSCTGEVVLFNSDNTGPYTMLSCPKDAPMNIINMAGFLFILPFAAMFFMLKKYPERNFGLIIVGIALVMSSLDFSAALPADIVRMIMLLGTLLLGIGEALLISAYISPEKKHRHSIISSD